MASITANFSAISALQDLNRSPAEFETAPSRNNSSISSNISRDFGAIRSVSRSVGYEVSGFGREREALDRLSSDTDIAVAAGNAVGKLLSEMKDIALSASDSTIGASVRYTLNNSFGSLRDQISSIVSNADLNGRNILRDANVGRNITYLQNSLSSADGFRSGNITYLQNSLSSANSFRSGNITYLQNSLSSADGFRSGNITYLQNSLSSADSFLSSNITYLQNSLSPADGFRSGNITYLQNSLSAAGGNFTFSSDVRVDTPRNALSAVQQVEASQQNLSAVLERLGGSTSEADVDGSLDQSAARSASRAISAFLANSDQSISNGSAGRALAFFR